MARKSLEHMNCSWAQTAEAIGDKWSIMIIRCAFYGADTFSEFLDETGISKNILTQRLDHLVKHSVLEKRPSRPGGTRYLYKLTPKGRALFPAIAALGQWGDEWIFADKGAPVVLVDRANNKPVQKVELRAEDGRALKLRDVTFVAGPGATQSTSEVAQSQFAQSDG